MIEIVVADQGWVFIGNVCHDQARQIARAFLALGNEAILLENANCIRRWGTSQGLGELVNGPTENTILDPMGCVTVKNVLFTIEVNQDAWKHVINKN